MFSADRPRPRWVDCVDINRQPALRGAPLESPPRVLDAPALSATERAALAAVGPEPLYTLWYGGGGYSNPACL